MYSKPKTAPFYQIVAYEHLFYKSLKTYSFECDIIYIYNGFSYDDYFVVFIPEQQH